MKLTKYVLSFLLNKYWQQSFGRAFKVCIIQTGNEQLNPMMPMLNGTYQTQQHIAIQSSYTTASTALMQSNTIASTA